MNISLPRILLPLLLAFAFVVRWEPTRTLRLAPDERDGTSSRWLLDDPETCQEMRRVELAIASDRVVEFDRFVNFPVGGEIPALPFFDSLVAGIAQRLLRSPTGEAALGHVDEADLEDFVVKLAPILGLLAVLVTYWAARTIVTGRRGDVAALVAAAIVAFHPATIGLSSAGKLDSAAMSVILFALLIRSVVRSIRGTTMPTSLLDALIAGALSGLLVSSSAVGFVLFVPAWLAFFVHALRSSGEARANAVRSGLLFSVVAAFLSRLTLSEGPWEQGAGVVHGFVSGVSILVLMSTAPFVVLVLLKQGEKPRMFRTVCFFAALVAMAWQAPLVWGDLAPAVRWFLGNYAEVTSVMPDLQRKLGSDWTTIAGLGENVLTALMIALPVVMWRRRVETTTLALLGFVIAGFAIMLVTGLGLAFTVVAVACLAASFFDRGLSTVTEPATRTHAVGAGVLAVFLVALAVAPALAEPDPLLRERRIEFVAGLRWMRAHTESGGAWNSPRSPSAWGVVSSVSVGPLVQYHARRPAVLSPWASLSGMPTMREWLDRLRNGPDLETLEHFMRGRGARYVVVGTGLDPRQFTIAVDSKGESSSVLALLLNPGGGQSADAVAGFTRSYAARRRVDAAGHTTMDGRSGAPVISIWALANPAPEMHESGLSPR